MMFGSHEYSREELVAELCRAPDYVAFAARPSRGWLRATRHNPALPKRGFNATKSTRVRTRRRALVRSLCRAGTLLSSAGRAEPAGWRCRSALLRASDPRRTRTGEAADRPGRARAGYARRHAESFRRARATAGPANRRNDAP